MPHVAEKDLWSFSLELYARPGVKERCINLQDALGLDVNIAFFCLWWSDPSATYLDQNAFDAIIAPAVRWHRTVVLPTRAARKASKGGMANLPAGQTGDLYRALLKVEIDTEHAEQTILVGGAVEHTGTLPSGLRVSASRAALNIALYSSHLGRKMDVQDFDDMAAIIALCCGVPPQTALSHLSASVSSIG
ncbi:TIGR02444 family protein [Mesorhizobium sp. M8A.F.Ca.ET.208.01.1.1]|uniref:TIGR02444 family protein n=1 Tax=unclassified Mesorhizobium TaxID=325217 RepID=UPI0010940D07|nr:MULTISPECIES: TIGR02444 family protein [unclassified Mesorhizobium]TGQ89103.1 TIGR02444 family protein [Mesorhizobium sp. M8A.F.Ca.ET.208.01.1.1]TGR32208.1 TIGR02444 family protein [Mesorhizobium sp. M8A.F.Ca.ET.202.01.1.1]TGT50423.1 TIGR02444 family protein [Mesorhizobium sp. M8A.F.Ca.ET.167.01.1.1]TGU40086.1 TIGR02444 family protein [bacterium M00.F.Ca.ET.156.01.1.1]